MFFKTAGGLFTSVVLVLVIAGCAKKTETRESVLSKVDWVTELKADVTPKIDSAHIAGDVMVVHAGNLASYGEMMDAFLYSTLHVARSDSARVLRAVSIDATLTGTDRAGDYHFGIPLEYGHAALQLPAGKKQWEMVFENDTLKTVKAAVKETDASPDTGTASMEPPPLPLAAPDTASVPGYTVIEERDVSEAKCRHITLLISVPNETAAAEVEAILEGMVTRYKDGWQSITVWAYTEEHAAAAAGSQAPADWTKEYSRCP